MSDHRLWLVAWGSVIGFALIHIGPDWWRTASPGVIAVGMMGLLLAVDPLVGGFLLVFTCLLAYQLGHVRPQDDPRPPDPWRHFGRDNG